MYNKSGVTLKKSVGFILDIPGYDVIQDVDGLVHKQRQ